MESTDLDSLFAAAPRTLEDSILTLREHCRLLADFFSIHAQALEGGARVELSSDSCYALSELCDRSADYLERLGKVMPGEIANWFPPVDAPRAADCLARRPSSGPTSI
jgi:hypothetical protein